MVVKTFRGLLADGAQERIKLQTSTGKVGYRIVKLKLIPSAPGVVSSENIVKVYNEFQSSIDGLVDFADSALLGASYYNANTSGGDVDFTTVVFDREIFNQDIYITHSDVRGSGSANYYLELEVIPLASDEAAITTVKAMRGLAVD